MASPNIDNIYRSPGRLVANPTNLQAAYPHGGTELGIARDLRFEPHVETRELVAEEFKSVVEVLTTAVRPILAGVMRTWDDSMMAILFPWTKTDSAGNVGLLHNVQTNRAGYRLSQKAVVLLFSPTSVALRKHVLFYNAVPVIDQTLAMRLSLKDELGLPFFFVGMPDAQARTHAVDLQKNLSL